MNRCIQSFWRAQRIVKPYTNCSYVSFVAHIPTSALSASQPSNLCPFGSTGC